MTSATQATLSPLQSRPRRRGRPPLAPPAVWEHRVLRLIAEQYSLPFDQLARFLECDEEQAARVAKHLTRARYADYGRSLLDEPHWVWLTSAGARFSGTDFAALRPRVGAMQRIRAVNEVRLHIARRAPRARWISGRSIVREQGKTGRRPNAVVEIEGERHAILVKHGIRQSEERERAIAEALMAGYDALIAFCAPQPRSLFERLVAEHHWPKLVIRPIPEPPTTPTDSPRL
jgi:hypothetical protein